MWDVFKTKTAKLGAVMILAGAFKLWQPELAEAASITIAPDVLIASGLAMIFGRDAIRKIGG